MPIFASNMGLLEPIRGPIDTKKETTKTEPALVDPSKAESPMSENQVRVEHRVPLSAIGVCIVTSSGNPRVNALTFL